MCSQGVHGKQALLTLTKSEVTAQQAKKEVKGDGFSEVKAGCTFQRRPRCHSSQEVTSPSLPVNLGGLSLAHCSPSDAA